LKKYLLDILIVVLAVSIAFLAAGRPVVDLNIRPPATDKKQPAEAKKQEAKKVQKETVRDVAASDLLKGRNIFSPDGKYPVLAAGGVIAAPSPDKPDTITYALMGVLDGEIKKAVLRESTVSIVALPEGTKLKDGSVITRIDKFSVELMKGKEKKELRMFDVKVPRLRRPAN
jgi:hypothetical protein